MSGPFTERQEAVLTSVASAMYPHPGLGEQPYRRVVATIASLAAADPVLGGILRDGMDELSACVEESASFRALRPLVARYLYDDPEVRAYIGYPGASYSDGGYVNRGFNDLRWLPEPPIEEPPEPLVEIGPLPYPLSPPPEVQ
ncbi:hypothetical protein LWC34_05805 [Kibdelosporangium philippinense]|uniref:Gluconate 2-dehydrogenase subunit 3 family protein n=1 Tax=Kibdelosporangium philippinense TaxID=211113 RepID=A0ABS8Z4L5_9PSEU|nr:hypothetical protein [Kibdelosporangium philippinense]MCE7002347.1 hypothetical protein [Kibdelosporangium philippinense]